MEILVIMKHLGYKLTLLSAVLFLTACSSGVNFDPIIDGQKGMTYYSNLHECQNYAKQQTVTPTGAAIGAVTGGLIASGGNRKDIAKGAAAGAGAGAAVDVGSTISKQKDIIRQCLRGRGYNVLN